MVTVTMTEGQANAAISALDLYARIGLGQIEQIAELVRWGFIVPRANSNEERKQADPSVSESVENLTYLIKESLGHFRNGSLGVGHSHVHIQAHRAWELKKALEKPLAEARNPNPSFRGVQYDGNIVRYTSDPEPEVVVSVISSDATPKP